MPAADCHRQGSSVTRLHLRAVEHPGVGLTQSTRAPSANCASVRSPAPQRPRAEREERNFARGVDAACSAARRPRRSPPTRKGWRNSRTPYCGTSPGQTRYFRTPARGRAAASAEWNQTPFTAYSKDELAGPAPPIVPKTAIPILSPVSYRKNRNAFGWGGRIRTCECRDQNPVPYHLATPQLQ